MVAIAETLSVRFAPALGVEAKTGSRLGAWRRCCTWLPLPAALGQRGALEPVALNPIRPGLLYLLMQNLNSNKEIKNFILCPRKI